MPVIIDRRSTMTLQSMLLVNLHLTQRKEFIGRVALDLDRHVPSGYKLITRDRFCGSARKSPSVRVTESGTNSPGRVDVICRDCDVKVVQAPTFRIRSVGDDYSAYCSCCLQVHAPPGVPLPVCVCTNAVYITSTSAEITVNCPGRVRGSLCSTESGRLIR